jgi:hypothetical protein
MLELGEGGSPCQIDIGEALDSGGFGGIDEICTDSAATECLETFAGSMEPMMDGTCDLLFTGEMEEFPMMYNMMDFIVDYCAEGEMDRICPVFFGDRDDSPACFDASCDLIVGMMSHPECEDAAEEMEFDEDRGECPNPNTYDCDDTCPELILSLLEETLSVIQADACETWREGQHFIEFDSPVTMYACGATECGYDTSIVDYDDIGGYPKYLNAAGVLQVSLALLAALMAVVWTLI